MEVAKAKGTNLQISTKQAIEVCNFIRGKTVSKARQMLNEVLALKRPVPYKIFKMDIPHRKGKYGPGRFPLNTVKAVLGMLNSAASNAEDKGLRSDTLIISTIKANRGPTVWRFGRQMRRKAKRTHLEIGLKEKAAKKRAPKAEEPKEAAKEKQPGKAQKEAAKPEKKEVKPEAEKQAVPEKAVKEHKEAAKPEKKEEKPKEKETKPKKEAVKND